MIRFSSNYCLCEPCFTIQNMPTARVLDPEESQYLPAVLIMKNILQRGKPEIQNMRSKSTLPSEFIQNMIPNVDYDEWFLPLIESDPSFVPVWSQTIKGDEKNDYYPALDFYNNIWSEYLPEYAFLRQLILPEAPLSIILKKNADKYHDQAVDFYLPCAKLVIEIDGTQHRETSQNFLDYNRDKELSAQCGIEVIRIPTTQISKKDDLLKSKMMKIKDCLDKCTLEPNNLLQIYCEYFADNSKLNAEQCRKRMQLTAIFRIQIFILTALKNGSINLNQGEWKLAVVDDEFSKHENWQLAFDDLMKWLTVIYKLMKIEFIPPLLTIIWCGSSKELVMQRDAIKVNFSIRKRWTDENAIYPDVIFVRTDYDPRSDYFRVETSEDLVCYRLIDDGPDSDRPYMEFILRNLFGYEGGFREGQYLIIKNLLEGKNTIGILPTGGGKTLCYLFAAALQPAISFVISPLRSLMHDQRRNVQDLGLQRVEYINSMQGAQEKNRVLNDFARGRYALIWISPERFQQESFRGEFAELIRTEKVAYAVIDEVHCLSEWGHSFRVSYLTLVNTIRRYAPHVILAGLTATASDNVLKDIKAEFGGFDTDIIVPPHFSRDNLRFQIRSPETIEKKYTVLKDTLRNLNDNKQVLEPNGEKTKSTVIFAINVGSKERKNFWCLNTIYGELMCDLDTQKIGYFHGSSDDLIDRDITEMQKQQEAFIDNKNPIIIATKAFGMGIDKPNIRYTFHYGIPSSLEALYQEAGRAGRDQEPADCLVLYTPDKLNEKDQKQLFAADCSIEKIQEIQAKMNACDVSKQLYLWLQNNRGIEAEINLAWSVYTDYVEKGKKIIFYEKYENYLISKTGSKADPNMKFLPHIQKALYHLYLLGIIRDWTINYHMKSLSIVSNVLPQDRIMANLISYIQRYDLAFTLTDSRERYRQYTDMLKNDNVPITKQLLRILITWIYDNIVYARRIALKNIVDLCNKAKNGNDFRQQIDEYFRISDESALLNVVAEHPLDYSNWFNVFRGQNDDVADTDKLSKIRTVLRRLFESNRYNAGLNYISGLIHLLINDFEDVNGKQRLQLALTDISQEGLDKTVIFKKTFSVLKSYDTDQDKKDILGELLTTKWPEEAAFVYANLEDASSLTILLKCASDKIMNIGGRVKW